MPDTAPTGDRLDELRRRWEEDRASRVFVQLAEEYRRRGEHEAALEVLEEGLEAHPNYLSAQVAMGRVRLELGHVDAARRVFERVVSQDPTHLVALKLLTESLLRQGNRAGALEALERYRLLGAPAEELEEIERSLGMGGAAVSSEPGAQGVAGEGSTAPSASSALEGADHRHQAPGGVSGLDSRRGSAGADLAPGQVFRLAPVRPPALRLTGSRRVEASRKVALSGAAAFEVPAPRRRRAVDEEIFPLWQGVSRARGAALAAVPMTEDAPREEQSLPLSALPEPRAEEPMVEPEPLSTPPPVTPQESETAAPVELAPDQEIPEEAATATLGEIYLRQGHLEEAARIFRRVLAVEPGNAAARSGLEVVARRREAPLDAETLLGAEGRQIRGITARKIFVLNRYLETIRRGREAR